MKNFFYQRFSSIISAKLIVNQETGRSKGYAFFEFTNYKEFSEALKLKGTLTFGKQVLVLNSAKNKYDYNDEDKINELNSINNIHNSILNNNEDVMNSSMISNITIPLSTAETALSSMPNSKEIFNIYNNGSTKYLLHSSKLELDNINNNGDEYFDDIQLQIKDSLKKMSEQYYQYDNKPSLFNYYCSPFVYNPQNRSNFYFVNNEENTNAYYHHNLYIKCPFESCKEK